MKYTMRQMEKERTEKFVRQPNLRLTVNVEELHGN